LPGALPNSSKIVSPACLSVESRGPRSSFLSGETPSPRAGKVVPCVLPAKAVQALVEVFRLQALLGTGALDLVVGVEAMGASSSGDRFRLRT
jgi:hypothetical protein